MNEETSEAAALLAEIEVGWDAAERAQGRVIRPATGYLLAEPANARRLLGSVERLEAGGGEVRGLVE